MIVWVQKDNVKYPCKNEEQVKLFLDNGYMLSDKTEAEEQPKAKKSTKK